MAEARGHVPAGAKAPPLSRGRTASDALRKPYSNVFAHPLDVSVFIFEVWPNRYLTFSKRRIQNRSALNNLNADPFRILDMKPGVKILFRN